jgi:hypothetical protein
MRFRRERSPLAGAGRHGGWSLLVESLAIDGVDGSLYDVMREPMGWADSPLHRKWLAEQE